MSLNLAFARLNLLARLKSPTRLKFIRTLEFGLEFKFELKPKFKAKFNSNFNRISNPHA